MRRSHLPSQCKFPAAYIAILPRQQMILTNLARLLAKEERPGSCASAKFGLVAAGSSAEN